MLLVYVINAEFVLRTMKTNVANTEKTIEVAESENGAQDATESDDIESTNGLTQRDAILINEDFAQIRLRKNSTNVLPAYEEYVDEGQSSKSKAYQFSKHGFSSFVRHEIAYIRKIVRYLMIGYCVLGETNRSFCFLYQKLMVVWIHQSVLVIFVYSNVSIEKNNKYLLGRVVQFSFLSGSKRDRHYTSTCVDMTKESFKTIGAFANWYIGVYSDSSHVDQFLPFMPFENFFSIGYLPMDQYVNTVSDECLVKVIDFSFGIPYVEITKNIPNWYKELTLENKSYRNKICV